MTRQEFVKAVGREPDTDELERANCPNAGTPGHWPCGICDCKRPLLLCPIHGEEMLNLLAGTTIFGLWARTMDKIQRQG